MRLQVANLAAERAPEPLVLAAGGVADGAVVGTRFWASSEALVSPRAHERAIGASTYCTRVYDHVRQLDWPPEYNEWASSNPFVDRWRGNDTDLLAALPDAVKVFEAAVHAEDFGAAAILIGESIGLVDAVHPAADILADMASGAERVLKRAKDFTDQT